MLKVQSHRTLANLQVNLLFYVHGYRFECATLAPSDLAQACTRCTTTCTTWSSEYTTPCPRWGAPFGLLPVGLEIGNILYNGWSTGAISLERTLHWKKKVTGWWFGTYILCFHILGMSWSQLTNSIFFQRGRWLNHQPGEPRWAGRWPPDDFPGFWRTLSTELLIMKRMNRREWSIFQQPEKPEWRDRNHVPTMAVVVRIWCHDLIKVMVQWSVLPCPYPSYPIHPIGHQWHMMWNNIIYIYLPTGSHWCPFDSATQFCVTERQGGAWCSIHFSGMDRCHMLKMWDAALQTSSEII